MCANEVYLTFKWSSVWAIRAHICRTCRDHTVKFVHSVRPHILERLCRSWLSTLWPQSIEIGMAHRDTSLLGTILSLQ